MTATLKKSAVWQRLQKVFAGTDLYRPRDPECSMPPLEYWGENLGLVPAGSLMVLSL